MFDRFRPRRVRGRNHLFGVVTVVLLQRVDGPKRIEPWLLVFIGFLLMITVDHTYCFLTHASLPLNGLFGNENENLEKK